MSVETRIANMNDVNTLHELNKACLPIYYSKLEYIYMLFMTNNYLTLLSTYNGLICGYLVAEYNDKKNVHILTFGVCENYRQKGIGRKLIDSLVLHVKDRYNEITLHVHVENIGGIEFYKKMGFSKTKNLKNYYNGSLNNVKSQDAIRMIRYL